MHELECNAREDTRSHLRINIVLVSLVSSMSSLVTSNLKALYPTLLCHGCKGREDVEGSGMMGVVMLVI